MPRFPTPWHPDAPQALSWLPLALDMILSPTHSLIILLEWPVGDGVACS